MTEHEAVQELTQAAGPGEAGSGLTAPPAIYRVIHKAARIDGTALEICEWARFHNMQFYSPGTTPEVMECGWATFTVARHDLKPLSADEIATFQGHTGYRHVHEIKGRLYDMRNPVYGGAMRHVHGIVASAINAELGRTPDLLSRPARSFGPPAVQAAGQRSGAARDRSRCR